MGTRFSTGQGTKKSCGSSADDGNDRGGGQGVAFGSGVTFQLARQMLHVSRFFGGDGDGFILEVGDIADTVGMQRDSPDEGCFLAVLAFAAEMIILFDGRKRNQCSAMLGVAENG